MKTNHSTPKYMKTNNSVPKYMKTNHSTPKYMKTNQKYTCRHILILYPKFVEKIVKTT